MLNFLKAYLQYSVTPIVSSLSVLDVVDGVISDDERVFEFLAVIRFAVSDQTVTREKSNLRISEKVTLETLKK